MPDIVFDQKGSGPPLILIHGFPMHRKVWQDFHPAFISSNTVYMPDLPGFGESPLLKSEFTLRDVGAAMNDWVQRNNIRNGIVVGHSLGGYVALEMVRQNPDRYNGLVLFHSTAYADSEEKKESRTKVVQFIRDNGVTAFTSNFIQPLFHDANHPAIPEVRALCISAGEKAVVGYTQAMRDRSDNTQVLREYGGPVFLLGGAHDKGIPPESLKRQATLNASIKAEILEDAAHMGMFESKDACAHRIRQFAAGVSQRN